MLFSGRMSMMTLHLSPDPGFGAKLNRVNTLGRCPSGNATTAPTRTISCILVRIKSAISGSSKHREFWAERFSSNGCSRSYHTLFSTQCSTHFDTPGPSSCSFFHSALACFVCSPPALKLVGSRTRGKGSHTMHFEYPPSSTSDKNLSAIAM